MARAAEHRRVAALPMGFVALAAVLAGGCGSDPGSVPVAPTAPDLFSQAPALAPAPAPAEEKRGRGSSQLVRGLEADTAYRFRLHAERTVGGVVHRSKVTTAEARTHGAAGAQGEGS